MCLMHKWRYDVPGKARTCVKCHRHETYLRDTIFMITPLWIERDCKEYEMAIPKLELELKNERDFEILVQHYKNEATEYKTKCKWK